MEKQTAVEWLFMTLALTPMTEWYNVLEQAKEIEKEQIKNAYWNGTTDMEKDDALLMAEDYFNEYYKK